MRFSRKSEKEAATAAAPAADPDSINRDSNGAQDVEKSTVLTDAEKPHESSDEEVQAGVRKIEATASVWSKSHLIAAYVIIWLIYFIASLQEVVVRTMNPFVTSAFSRHSLTAAVGIIASVFGGLSKLTLAKILDTWGRPQGLALMMLIWVIGFIMMAKCPNVETYAAAQVFSTVGAQGVSYCLTVFISDTTSLLNRALMLAFATTPYIVTPWIGGPVSDSILAKGGIGWRWGFAIWTIVTPAVVLPLVILSLWNQRKARKQGLLEGTNRPITFRSILDLCIEIDLVGIILLTGGMALFLLPFSIWSYQAQEWRSPMIICMIIFGAVLLVVFVLWEKFLAPVKFIPMSLLADRTVFFGGLMLTFIFANSTIWGQYFTSMLLIVWNTGVTKATYISNIYRTGSCFSALVLAYLIRRTQRFKWVAMYFAVPLMILGVGLMIHFRQPSQDVGYVAMTQIFVAFAGGPIVIAAEMAMMAPSDHQHIAVLIAILDLFSSTGAAIGSTISAGIWTGTFKRALRRHLPEGAPVDSIYSSLYTQLAYPAGTPIRQGIALAYGDAQRYMVITSVCFAVCALVCVGFWRDIKLTSKNQTKGNVI
ncbi:Major facilitator superfamily domain, general substrate transporter [Paramyrothecium foliicola]|nr:Major facilitator superfamily domain, general substrate transporter [Paramyrothecium foliicola]